MNSTIYHAINQCSTTGLESLLYEETLGDSIVRLFKDHKGYYRIVAFLPNSLHGYSGVIVMPSGEIYYKETNPLFRGNNTTRMLQAMLALWGIRWYPSQYQTKGGAACYG